MSDIGIENTIVMKKVSDVKPYKNNPRRNDKTVKLLCDIIPKVGFNVPLVIDKHNVIVKGDARFKAAKILGMDEVPCIVTHADEDAIKADRITDNRVSEFSEWLEEGVLHEVDMLDLEFDISSFGLPSIREGNEFDFEFDSGADDFGGDNKEITTQRAIDDAIHKQSLVGGNSRDYIECKCEKCGNVILLRKGVKRG